MKDNGITKEQFFKDWEMELQLLPGGSEELAVTVASGQKAKDAAWNIIEKNLDLAMIYTIGTEEFNFCTDTAKYVFVKCVDCESEESS